MKGWVNAMEKNIEKITMAFQQLNKKINYLDKHAVNMNKDNLEEEYTKIIEEIVDLLELVDELFDYLNEHENDMSWENYDAASEELINLQTYLVEKQSEYSSKLLEGYSEELISKVSGSRKENLGWNITRRVGRVIFGTIKKGATYVWDNKEELYASMMEKGEEQQNKIREQKSRMEALVERQSMEEIKRNVQNLRNKKQNGGTITLEEKFYYQVAKIKIKKTN